MSIKAYFFETRPNFLILPFVLIFLGTSMAWHSGYSNFVYTVLSLIGLLLLHISTNVLNEYNDYKSGVDFNTNRTPFSGGSGILVSGQIPAKNALWMGVISFILAVPVGVYFVFIKGWLLLPIFIIGSVIVLFYTSHIAKLGLGCSEISAGLGLGTLPVLGVYIILNHGYTSSAIYASIPSGIFVFNLLFLNEFPDADADRIGGRKTLPIIIGKDKSAVLYSVLTFLVYAWIFSGTLLKLMPPYTLIALLTLPIAIKAMKGSFVHSNKEIFIQAQAANVQIIMLTQIFIGIGFILAKVI
ncbi:prenyltransferase [candidate division KSB1 bacterium]